MNRLLFAMAAVLLSCGGESDGGGAGGDDSAEASGSSSTGDATPCTIRIEGAVELERGACLVVPTNATLQVHGDIERDGASFEAAGVDAVASAWQYLDGDLGVGTYEIADLDAAGVTVRLDDGTYYAASLEAGSATLTLTAWDPTFGARVHGTIVGTLPELTADPEPGTVTVTIEF